MYVATRGLFKMKPPTIVVPKCLKATVEKLFDVHRELDGSELKHHLIGLDVGMLSLSLSPLPPSLAFPAAQRITSGALSIARWPAFLVAFPRNLRPVLFIRSPADR